MSDTEPTEITVLAADGARLAARLFRPPAADRGRILIVPAMGTSQRFYAALARWLAAQGFLVATFDYRGTGASRRGPLRRDAATIEDWWRLDCAAMIERLGAEAGGPLCWLGHSLGGQLFPLVPNIERVERVVCIASGSGYWRQNARPLRHVVWILWYLAVPLLTPLCGYFPGRRLGMVGDLPRGVIRQWRRWCLHPHYHVGVEGEPVRAAFAAWRRPVSYLAMSDDEFMSEASLDALLHCFTQARVARRRLHPPDFGLPRIGHFGFFRREAGPALWHTTLLPALETNANARTSAPLTPSVDDAD